MRNARKHIKPSEFYRMRRPEYFSDSEIVYAATLPKEHLSYELAQISTNQKQDEFEVLCRRLVEKLIAPNLIPQVGPTGGGDGKTDSETYSVSESISDRWFIPDNGWEKDEKWAFAISSKKDWKNKAKSDIEKIIATEREYSKIFFITNQTPSSGKKKESQDSFRDTYGLEIIILDGTWILEKVYDNNLIDIVVDSLNMSDIYKEKRTVVGQNDAYHNKLLQEKEEKITNPNRYFEHDFQLVEDALDAAILSRKLEKPRDEIEGRFDRAFRFCEKLNNNKQWIRLHYQRAWTYIFYYDDYSAFIKEFKEFKKYISSKSSISEIELYFNLFNTLNGACAANCNLQDLDIDIQTERKYLYAILDEISSKNDKPCSSLIAKVYKSIENIFFSVSEKRKPDEYFKELSGYFTESKGLIEFPFESNKKLIEEFGIMFPDNIEYDNLIDIIASQDEKRSSELTAGKTYLLRGGQKLMADFYKESVIYFGKAVRKLAKEESGDGFYFALKGLGHAYNEMGLLWASNNCFLSATSIAFKSWYEKGILDSRVFDCAKHLAINEEFIGRVPSFLSWHELFLVIKNQIDKVNDAEEIPIADLIDACMAVRLLNTSSEQDAMLSWLPDILEDQNLWISQNAVLFKLGYTELIIDEYKKSDIKNEDELSEFFRKTANQQFREQMLYKTNFIAGDELQISSKILGCTFHFIFQKDIELLLAAETFAAFFESFLATSIKEIEPSTEDIYIKLIRNTNEKLFQFKTDDLSLDYQIEINKFSFSGKLRDDLLPKMIELTSRILFENFFVKDSLRFLENLFKKEEVHERTALIFEHRNFTISILGDRPKLFFENWKKPSIKSYESKRLEPLNYSSNEDEKEIMIKAHNGLEQDRHDERKVLSIIEDRFWNQAHWKGFGPFYAPNVGFGIFLAFENGDAGKAIFDNWIKKFGKEDKEDKIKITIVKGTNKHNPYWYRVHITSNIEKEQSKERYFSVTSRFHEMTPHNHENLNKIESCLKRSKNFGFFPAKMSPDGSNIEPYLDKAIVIHNIEIKYAWEIGLNDYANSAIKKDDDPYIPNNIENAPVLKLIEKLKEMA